MNVNKCVKHVGMISTCLDGECRLGGRVTDIAGGDDVDSKSYNVAMACGYDWE